MDFKEIENNLKRAREIYIKREVPKDMNVMIKGTIKSVRSIKSNSLFKSVGICAASLVLIISGFAVGVNTNEAFAKSLGDIPVLSYLVKIFTLKQVKAQNDIYTTKANIPAIAGMNDEEFQSKINTAIYDKITEVIDEAQKGAEEYKKAFMATGGKEEDFTQVKINADYELEYVSENMLSFIIIKTDTTASAYNYRYYYNIDLLSNKEISLSDIFGQGYIEDINENIKSQIAKREEQSPEDLYFKEDMDGFQSISAEQKFYINSDKKVVIVFDKYEIAPGYMGVQEFIINDEIQI